MTLNRIVGGIAALGSVFVVVVFAHGYWHTVTHGVFEVRLRDLSGGDVRHPDASVTFRDKRGRALAEFATDASSPGVFYVSEPSTYICREIEKRASFEIGGHEAYRDCWERQSRWIVSWGTEVKYADARIGDCRWDRASVALSVDADGPGAWWRWLDPWRGAIPLTRFQAAISVIDRCAEAVSTAVPQKR
jgi:hypothetical protein